MALTKDFKLKREIAQLIETAMQAHLEDWEITLDFTIEEIELIYNGIGPDRFPDWLRRIVTASAHILEPAALIHDLEYQVGGAKKNFHEANKRFGHNCRILVKNEFSWWNPMRWLYFNRIRRWVNFCQLFGWSGWHKTS